MAYTGSLRPKGVTSFRFQVYERVRISHVEVHKRVGKFAFPSVNRPKSANRRIYGCEKSVFCFLFFFIVKDKKKTCCLDPIPTKLVLDCLDILLPVITKIINYSLEHGVFPSVWKNILVFSLLKKYGLEPIFKNYRPVSNLQFISKLTESAVAKQLQHHINMNNLFPSLQSSYRKFHSTESALLKAKK